MANIAFVTGATSGFGAACARLFATHGWKLIICGRRQDRHTPRVIPLPASFQRGLIAIAADAAKREFGRFESCSAIAFLLFTFEMLAGR